MHLNIQGRHLTITPSINDYVKAKLKRVKNHFKSILFIHVVLETVKNTQIAEVTLTSERHHFHNKIKTKDLYKSIDLLFDKIEKQVRRYKEHQEDKYQKKEPLREHLKEVEDTEEKSKVIVNDVEIPSIPMNDLEAVLQLSNENKQNHLGFFNEKITKIPSFLIKKNDSTYNLISYSQFWELKELEIFGRDKIKINQIFHLKPPLEIIEDSINYLEHHENEKVRFFISLRTKKSMFLYKNKPGHYSLIREKV